jgi:hypothetical protein
LFFILFPNAISVLLIYSELPIPASFWSLLPFNVHLNLAVKTATMMALLLTSFFWLAEKKMAFTSSIIAILSTLILSIEESNGIYNRNITISAVFWAIAIAYSTNKKKEDIEQKRLDYPLQIVAVTYVLSGLSKIFTSGISWVISGKYFTMQIIKNHYTNAFSSNNYSLIAEGYAKADFFMNHIWLVNCVFTFTLLVELFAFTIIVKPAYKIVYGCLILLMHLGIYLLMDIHIGGIFAPMIIVIFNPVYFVVNIFNQLKIESKKI